MSSHIDKLLCFPNIFKDASHLTAFVMRRGTRDLSRFDTVVGYNGDDFWRFADMNTMRPIQ